MTGVVVSDAGVGRPLVDATSQRDAPIVQGAALAVAFPSILVHTLTDSSHQVLDPRMRQR